MPPKEMVVFDRRKIIFLIKILRTSGIVLILISISGIVLVAWPSLLEEAKYRLEKTAGIKYKIPQTLANQKYLEPAIPAPLSLLREIMNKQTEKILIPKSPEFSIVIPKIGASAPVFPNIDANNENEYLPILQNGVAHAKGTFFPGQNGLIYLFAHSTDNFWNVGRYNAIFYLLKDLKSNDQVVIFFQNKRFNYKVFAKKIIAPNETDILTKNLSAGEILVLQTCWPPGTTFKRLLILAKPS